jgi:hypothetical protein
MFVEWFLWLLAHAAITAYQSHDDNRLRLRTMPWNRAFRADDERLLTA